MTAEERAEYLRAYGFLPISGGDGSDEDEDDSDENDDEDEDEGDEDGSKNRKPASAKKEFTQADLNRILGQKIRSERKKIEDAIRSEITTEMEKEKAKIDNDLAAQLKLAEKELADLPLLKSAVLKFSDLAEQRYLDALETLPEHIRMMAPDEDADPLTKESWLTEKALPAAKQFASISKEDEKNKEGDKKPSKPGNKPRTPASADEVEVDENKLKALVKRLGAAGEYRPMG